MKVPLSAFELSLLSLFASISLTFGFSAPTPTQEFKQLKIAFVTGNAMKVRLDGADVAAIPRLS